MLVDIEALETFEPPGQHRKTTKALHKRQYSRNTETYPHSGQCHPLCLLYRVNNEALAQYAACRYARYWADVNGGLVGVSSEQNVPLSERSGAQI